MRVRAPLPLVAILLAGLGLLAAAFADLPADLWELVDAPDEP